MSESAIAMQNKNGEEAVMPTKATVSPAETSTPKGEIHMDENATTETSVPQASELSKHEIDFSSHAVENCKFPK